jgi:hypothetical protein
MFEDEDLAKAEQLQSLGYRIDIDVIELAKLIYNKRKQIND